MNGYVRPVFARAVFEGGELKHGNECTSILKIELHF